MVRQGKTGLVQIGAISLLLGILLGIWLIPYVLHADEEALYFDATGHNLTNAQGFLNFWRAHDGERLLGAPVTEVVTENGMLVQYFERGRLELHAEVDGMPIMRGRVGAEYAEALWRTFKAPALHIVGSSARTFEITGHTLNEPFLDFWEQNGGVEALGYPVSEPLWEYIGNRVLLVQYFERVRLEYQPLGNDTLGEIHISDLGRDLALMRGFDTTPVEPIEYMTAEYESAAATDDDVRRVIIPAEQKTAAVAVASTGGKHIVVDLSDQWLYAFVSDTLVFDAPVATGKDGFNTPTGNFAVYAKLRSQTMSGTLGGESYYVPDVPHVMYINGGVALHGAYWHNQFGTGVRLSHGCINLPLDSASWLYEWASMGTPVSVQH